MNSGTSGSTTNRLFTKTGGGTLILAGDNAGSGAWNFSGGRLTVAQGAVRLTVAGALGQSANPYTVSPGGALEFSFPGTASIGQTSGAHIVSGSGVAGTGALRTVSGTVTLTGGAGSISLPAAAAFGVDTGKMTIGHVITGTGSLTKVGAGILQLNSGSNSYGGGTLVSDGLLIVSNSTAMGPGPLTIQGGGLDILASGAGDLSLGAGVPFTMTSGSVNLLLGTAFDRVLGSGGAGFSISGGTLALDVSGTGFDYANSYQVFAGFSSGSVSGLAINGYDAASYTAALSNGGLLSFSAVPEPTSLVLVGLPAAMTAYLGLRRRVHRREWWPSSTGGHGWRSERGGLPDRTTATPSHVGCPLLLPSTDGVMPWSVARVSLVSPLFSLFVSSLFSPRMPPSKRPSSASSQALSQSP
jgi:autotransporter-associated beta strand protein